MSYFKELYRVPIKGAKFEDFESVQDKLWLQSSDGYPTLSMVHRTRFNEYCNNLITMYGEGDLVVTENCGCKSIEFDNPNFKAIRDKHMQAYVDFYNSVPSGGFTGD